MSAPARIAYAGTPEFAVPALRAIAASGAEIPIVLTQPDRPAGRGRRLTPSPVKVAAQALGVDVAQPVSLRDPAVLERLGPAPDLLVVAAYGLLLPKHMLEWPRLGCVNLHASLLPRWRGADPITRAIVAGDAETGVTIMQMVLEMDAGDMLLHRAIPIAPDDDGDTLEAKLARLGASALGEALDLWRAGKLTATPQDPALVTLAPMVSKADGEIDWSRPAVEIERAVRGYVPWPVASTVRAGAPLRVWRSEVATAPANAADATPGTVLAVDARGIVVATGDGALRLLEVQAAGKKRMPAADWARGARLTVGERFGA